MTFRTLCLIKDRNSVYAQSLCPRFLFDSSTQLVYLRSWLDWLEFPRTQIDWHSRPRRKKLHYILRGSYHPVSSHHHVYHRRGEVFLMRLWIFLKRQIYEDFQQGWAFVAWKSSTKFWNMNERESWKKKRNVSQIWRDPRVHRREHPPCNYLILVLHLLVNVLPSKFGTFKWSHPELEPFLMQIRHSNIIPDNSPRNFTSIIPDCPGFVQVFESRAAIRP